MPTFVFEDRKDMAMCDKCLGKIGDTDVEGQYSGICAHCRGDE
jgi:hypothetical protein